MKILITGGAGYLGSCICFALEDEGHTPIILDSLVSGHEAYTSDRLFYQGDIADRDILVNIYADHPDIELTIHCAEMSAVSNSVLRPYEYYNRNVFKSMELFRNLRDVGCKKIIFSSSAAIYEDVPGFMVTESSPINPKSPFARTKHITELILKDFCTAYEMQCIALRYFNPAGADPKNRCGIKDRNPKNIIGRLLRVYEGFDEKFVIQGTDWPTRDGTCMRDYVHIWDAANANVLACENFDTAFKNSDHDEPFLALNIGSGVGVTVQEFIFAFENVSSSKIPTEKGEKRLGDIGGSYANIRLAKKTINWEPKFTIEEAIIDALNWEEVKSDILLNDFK